jgi:zinc transport system substrate-binding protein
MLIVARIAEGLAAVDPANATSYQANAAAYTTELAALDEAFQEVVASARQHTLVFGDRFPFRYLVDAYGLDYYAAFPGCSTETEASAATVAFLIDKVRDEHLPVVLHIELGNERMAQAIAAESGAEVRELNAAHNITRDDFAAGRSYLDIQWDNVAVLRESLA